MKSKFPISQTSSLVPTKHEKKQIKSETGGVVEDKSKRRLLRNIAVTTPVVLAVSSKPALANAAVSGMMSGNLSNQNGTAVGGQTFPETFASEQQPRQQPRQQPTRKPYNRGTFSSNK